MYLHVLSNGIILITQYIYTIQITHYRTHMKSTHGGIKDYYCFLCGMGATRKDGIFYHLMCHMNVYKHSCQPCIDQGKPDKEIGKVSHKIFFRLLVLFGTGSFINHVVKFSCIFDSPSWPLLLNKAYVIKLSIG